MPSIHKGFDYYYKRARDNGNSRDRAFEYAAYKYLDLVYDLCNFSEDDLTREDLVLSMLIKYRKHRDRHNTHKEALAHVLRWAREEVVHHIEKVSAAGNGQRGGRNVWDGLVDLLDALPEDITGSGWQDTRPPPIFEDMRAASEAAGRGGRTYKVEERRPGGGIPDESAPTRSSSYSAEDRRPSGSGSSRHASYASGERFSGRNDREEYYPPRKYSSYNTEERRPRGSGYEEYASSRHTSSFSTADRRPRTNNRSPSPLRRYSSPPRRESSHHSQRPSYASSSSTSNHSHPSSHNTRSYSHRPRPRSPSPPLSFSDYIKPSTDLYIVLNLSRSASTADVKAARRKLGLLYHPDKAKAQGLSEKEATEKMREINLACDVLEDEEGRKWYNRMGTLPAMH